MNILDYTYDKFLDGEAILLDAHNHIKHRLDFKSLCFGLLPSGYPIDKEFETEDLKVGLGFHPWAVATAEGVEIDIFKKYVSEADFIGEVGLDFSEKHLESKDKQLKYFKEVCESLRDSQNKVISLHAVKASTEVMDLVEANKLLEKNVVIFHWFSGSSEELKRALDSGYYFSVGPKMLATNKGHEYIRQIPEDRMFIETDLPWDGEEITPEQHLNLLNDFAMQLREVKSY